MVRIQQAPEPLALTKTRRTKLPEAVKRWNEWRAASAGSDEETKRERSLIQYLNDGYNVVRDDLLRLQHKKCAYCERAVDGGNHHIEHFRSRRPIDRGWWWLTWSWDNLLISCPGCNGPKDANSPLMSGAYAAQPSAPTTVHHVCTLDPSSEGDTILHPRLEDPSGALVWVVKNPGEDPAAWVVIVVGVNPRGAATNKLVSLDLRCDHLNEVLRERLGLLIRDLRDRRSLTGRGLLTSEEAQRRWAAVQDLVNNPDAEFRAATAAVMLQLWHVDRLGDPRGYGLPEPVLP